MCVCVCVCVCGWSGGEHQVDVVTLNLSATYEKLTTNSLEHHSSMMNVTARLVIKVRHLPNFEFNWSDCTPQRSRDDTTIDDLLPSVDDSKILYQRALDFTKEFLVTHFTTLSDLKQFLPGESVDIDHPAVKSEVIPMKMLMKDEKYAAETIDILTQIFDDAGLTGDHQVQ